MKQKSRKTPEQKEGAFSNFRISSKTKSFESQSAVIAQAHTGTGKTFSFAIPLIEKLQSDALERKMGRPQRGHSCFAEQVEEILVSAYKKGSEDNPQTLLFSATCPNWVYDVAKKYMRTKFEQVELIGKKTKKNHNNCGTPCNWMSLVSTSCSYWRYHSGIQWNKELAINSSITQETQSLHGDIPQKQRKIILKGFRNGSF
uniref:DEAD/DEAH-box helicase domain-containing protein n=1 Tax=Erpetoichthys calabaricus TaxID=27687 RepID=A0A8C4TC82_ERPCA